MSETAAPVERRSNAGLIEASVIVLVAVAALVFQLWLPSTQVADADYQSVAGVLKTEAQPGDAVMLAPWWTERARMFVPEGLSVTGYQGCESDALETHQRIWLLSEPKQPRAGLSAFLEKFLPQRTEIGSERQFGNLTLRLFQNGRFRRTTYNALEHLGEARVYLENSAGERQQCAFDGRTHRCQHVGVGIEWHEINFAPHQCIRFNPPPAGLRLVAEFTNVPAADSLTLSGAYFWDRGYFTGPTVSDSNLMFEVNGELTALPLLRGTVPLQTVERRNSPAGATVRVIATTTAPNPNARDVCFELRGFEGTP